MDRRPAIQNFAPPQPFATFGLLGVFRAIMNYREAYSAHARAMTPATRQAYTDAEAALLSAVLMMPDVLRAEEGHTNQTMEPAPGLRIKFGAQFSYDLYVPMTPDPSRDLPIWWAHEAERIGQDVWSKIWRALADQTEQFAKRAEWERSRGAGLMPGATKLD